MAGDGVGLNTDSTGKKMRTQTRLFPRTWVAATATYVGEFIRPTSANGHIYRATSITGGGATGLTHATTQPTWPTTASGTVVDNQVTWTEFGTDQVHDQYTINVDETTGNAARVLNAAPSSTDYGLLTRPIPATRTQRTIYAHEITGIITTEALVTTGSVNSVVGFATATTGNPFTVTTGKTFRIQSIVLCNKLSTTTINWTRINIRVASSGATASSPIVASVTATAPVALAAAGSTVVVPFPDGLDIPSTYSIAISHISGAATGTNSYVIHGYEYS